jgi:hypothetical protein
VIPPAPASIAPLVDPVADKGPVPVRKLAVEAGARVDLPFEGTGWTYLGEVTGKAGVLYDSRRFENPGLVFSLIASKPGDFVLRFQRQDALRGTSKDEIVSLSVTPKPQAAAPGSPAAGAAPAPALGTGTAAAQAGSGPAPAAARLAMPASAPGPSASGAAPGAAPGTSAMAAAPGPSPAGAVPGSPAAAAVSSLPAAAAAPALPSSANAAASSMQASPSAPAMDSPEGMLLAARNELAAGRPQGAIDALDRLLARYPSGMDEAFFLYGSALEQSGPLKDIQRAYGYYKKLRDDYPMSPLWDKASERISYIERHYFEIR